MFKMDGGHLIAVMLFVGVLVAVSGPVHADNAAAPAVAAPAVAAPTVTAPTVTAPTVTAPAVTAPTVTAPTVTAPTVVAPAVVAPAVTAPAVAAPAVAAPAAPAIVGSYDVLGSMAVDKSEYEGVASVIKRGEAYQVTYQDSENKLIGVGIVMGNQLGVAYNIDGTPTILLMEPDGTTGWKGRFVAAGEEFINKEVWKRR